MLSVQRRYLLTYTYESELLYSKGCIDTPSTYQTLITLITESLSSRQITFTARWLPLTGIHRCLLVVGPSLQSAHSLTESKEAKKPTKKDTSMTNDRYLENAIN